MAILATKLREIGEANSSLNILRESESRGLAESKIACEKLARESKIEKEERMRLEKQVSALGEECLKSVPKERLISLENELASCRSREQQRAGAIADLQKGHEGEMREIKSEVEKLSSQLKDERVECKRLRSLSSSGGGWGEGAVGPGGKEEPPVTRTVTVTGAGTGGGKKGTTNKSRKKR